MNPTLSGMPWYQPGTYQQMRHLMADAHEWFATHAGWLAAAERTERRLRQEGATTVRVPLDPVHFPVWCAQNRRGLPMDAEARVAYATAMAIEKYRAGEVEVKASRPEA